MASDSDALQSSDNEFHCVAPQENDFLQYSILGTWVMVTFCLLFHVKRSLKYFSTFWFIVSYNNKLRRFSALEEALPT